MVISGNLPSIRGTRAQPVEPGATPTATTSRLSMSALAHVAARFGLVSSVGVPAKTTGKKAQS